MSIQTVSADKTMKVFIPFLKATAQVLEEITQEIFTKKNIYSFQGNITVGQVKVEIGIVGDIQTRVIFDFPSQFIRDLASIMMGIAEESEMNDELVMETSQEIGNMISGNAMGVLEENNIHCDITPPTVYDMNERDVEVSDRTSIGVIELTSNIGEFNIYVIINENDSLQKNINILNIGFNDEVNLLLARFFFPKGIGVINANFENASQFIDYYKPDIILINSTNTDYCSIVPSIESLGQVSVASFGEKCEELAFLHSYIYEESIKDPYDFFEKVKDVMNRFKFKIFAQRKEYIVSIHSSHNTRCVFATNTRNGDYEEIPIIRLGLESLILDISGHMDINFPEEKSLTKNIFLKFTGGITVPISKLKIGKTLANGVNVQIFLDHILETDISKITDFMYYNLSSID